jgi:RimJ/RimL family protein N-acetyltransferase
MQLETQRLILRPWQPNRDANHAMDIYGDSRVTDWLEGESKDSSIREVQSRLQRYKDGTCQWIVGSWAVEQKDIGRVIGHVLLMSLPDLENEKQAKRSLVENIAPLANASLSLQPRASTSDESDRLDSVSTLASTSVSTSASTSTSTSTSTDYADGLHTDYVEISWHFRPASWGSGYATEAASRIVEHAFDSLSLPLLLAVSDPENRRSVAVAERLGMQYDGTTTRYYGGKALLMYTLPAPSR